MKLKVITGIMLTLFLIGMLTLTFNIQPATASLPVHNINTGLDYPSIQEAINAPETLDGHTILVDAGTYYEHVVVNKTISLIGQNRTSTIVDGSYTGTVVEVRANNVNTTGFTIRNSGEWKSGITLGFVSGIRIYGNNLDNNYDGIFLSASFKNTISKNNFTGNRGRNILLGGSFNNIISENNLDNAISGSGIALLGSFNNSIYENNLRNNYYGLFIKESDDNIVSGNNIGNNKEAISLEESFNNTIYHNNFLNSTIQVKDYSWEIPSLKQSINAWDNGYPYGGNYWSDYADIDLYSGPYQDETGSDGIGDTPYVIDGNNTDNYPLMYLYGLAQDPTASFTYEPLTPLVNQTVTFNASGSLPGWNGTHNLPIGKYAWDFGDGNQTTSSQPILTHKYYVDGDYTVILNVSDTQGRWNTTSKQITVMPWNPTANFDFSPTAPSMFDVVTFNASSSQPGWNGTHIMPIVNYTWNFGDGNITTLTSAIITHVYVASGIYNVTLTVTDNDGLTDSMIFTITVWTAPIWMQWWFWIIVSAGIVILVGAVYFLKKRKPPTPTALPEGTLQTFIILTLAIAINKRKLLKTPIH